MLQQVVRNSKRFRIDSYGKCALVIILAGSILRLILISVGWPFNNSDESTMELMALHINTHGETPIFYYGQHYMGTMEAYIGAFMFRLLGPTVFAMRLGMIPLFSLFLFCTYKLTSKLYTQRLALFSIFLLSLGSISMLRRQIETIGGYPEILFLGSLLFVLSTYLAFSRHQGLTRWRLIIYGFWGLVAGFSIWTDMLIVPCIAGAGLILVVFCWREMLKGAIFALLVGLIIGGWPMIIYNLTAAPGEDSISVFLQLSKAGARDMSRVTLPLQISGTVFIGIPYSTGGVRLACPIEAFMPFSTHHPKMLQCMLTQGVWGIGYVVLLALGMLMALFALWKTRKQTVSSADTFEQSQEGVRQFSRLALLISALLTILMYMRTPAPVMQPIDNARYLMCVLISTPAILWPLWKGFSNLKSPINLQQKASLFVRGAMLFFVCVVLINSTVHIFQSIPAARAEWRAQQQLMDGLIRMGATRIYTDYWTGGRITFNSQEKIIAAEIRPGLTRYPDRYLPYRDVVMAEARPFYVFPLTSQHAQNLEHYLNHDNKTPYERYIIANYLIIRPVHPIPIPFPEEKGAIGLYTLPDSADGGQS